MEKEKENAIIELLKQSKSYSQIEEQLHVSSRDISYTKKKFEEEQNKVDEEQKKVQISKTSQALSLFEQGGTPVRVAIELDMEPDEADILYKVYCRMNGRTKLNEIYDRLGDNLFSFIELYEHIEKEGMDIRQVVNLLKVAEEIPNLQAERQHIEDCIDIDGPKISELIRRKLSAANDLRSILEEVRSATEYRNNQLKSIKEELELAREDANNELKLEQENLVRQKAFLANEVATAQEHTKKVINNSKECLLALKDADNLLKFTQKKVDMLRHEEQQLTRRVERLTNEAGQEQYVQPQLVSQQPVQKERPNLSEEERRILAIPVLCKNWESNWKKVLNRGL